MIPFAGAEFEVTKGVLDIFFAGCSLRCPGCQNPELQDPKGNTKGAEALRELVTNPLVKTIRLMGGEPTEQEGLLELLKSLDSFKGSIWLFTGHEEADPKYLPYLDYVKLGGYKEDSEPHMVEGLLLASKNQTVIKGDR